MMTKNGKRIQAFLENFQYELLLGCSNGDHRYSQNGTISCIRCGKTNSD